MRSALLVRPMLASGGWVRNCPTLARPWWLLVGPRLPLFRT
nr:MAG TPA: hypothetical protein [Inoviridae sp.]